MRLCFSAERSIGQVSSDFEKCFPYLKLKFFISTFLPSQISLWDHEISESSLAGQLQLPHASATIEFSPSISALQFEKLVAEKTGLFVKLYRRKNNDWAEIKNSRDSLERLNRIGMASEPGEYNYYTLFL